MLARHEARSDMLTTERTHGRVREEVAATRGDAPALGSSSLHAAYLRDVTEARPTGRTKIATETKTLKVGDRAPEFSLRAHDGRTITLSALRGQRVVLAFMAFAFSGT